MLRPRRTFKEAMKDMLHMHRGERRGLLVLAMLCMAAMAWVTWEQWLRPHFVTDKDRVEAIWAALPDSNATSFALASTSGSDRIVLFNFDPNTNTREQWVQLGLSERQAASVLRYVEHGGTFRSKRDLAKMRVIAPELFARWEPFVQLPDEVERKAFPDQGDRPWTRGDSTWKKKYPDREPATAPALVEINSADTVALVALRGIGPAFARAITRYRDRLGGFISLDQLNEIGLLKDKPDAVANIRRLLVLDPTLVHKLPINTGTSDELGRHPYIGWKLAKALVAYRTQHGPFQDVQALTGCVLVTDSMLGRIAPYIELK